MSFWIWIRLDCECESIPVLFSFSLALSLLVVDKGAQQLEFLTQESERVPEQPLRHLVSLKELCHAYSNNVNGQIPLTLANCSGWWALRWSLRLVGFTPLRTLYLESGVQCLHWLFLTFLLLSASITSNWMNSSWTTERFFLPFGGFELVALASDIVIQFRACRLMLSPQKWIQIQ